MFDLGRARKIKLLGFDVDGVLTDNAVFIGDVSGQRVEFKRFDIQDGLAHSLLKGNGIDVAWISGRQSEATTLRGQELRVPDVLQVISTEKVPAIEALLTRKGLTWDEVAFVGDDFADIPVFEKVGLAISVANGREEAKRAAHHVTEASGGHGAVREVIERLLKSRGSYEASVARYLGRTEWHG
jgi:3-deoxy-D-manno-octulosonate 8-phosphate phosphatase (KDO 8-P phosphatase)